MYIHLLNDIKFARSEIEVFEKYYPGQSLYVFSSRVGINVKLINDIPDVPICDIKPFDYRKILAQCTEIIDCVLVYSANRSHVQIALSLRKKTNCKIYWMLFGMDLYDRLHYVYHYPLYDYNVVPFKIKLKKYISYLISNRAFLRFANAVDSFCFWNPNDFKLMQNYFGAKQVRFRYYGHGSGWPVGKIPEFKEKDLCRVQVNHSASPSNNHLTILRKLEILDSKKQLRVFLPLNYGLTDVVKQVEDFTSHSALKCDLLTKFLPLGEYYAAVALNGVAIFGSHRQEAGGNIITALRNGVKVYLRNDNNLLHLFRSWGMYVFSFEDDLNSMEDLLQPLTQQQKIDNYKAVTDHMSTEVVAKSMQHFFE